MDYTADVAVIGGGIIGTATAYYLSSLGAEVMLLERSEIGSGTSSACDGCVLLQSKSPGIHLELALASAELYSTLAEELDWDIEYNPCGAMVIIEREEELAAMETFMQQQRGIGLDVRLLKADDARLREPHLAEHIAGATYSPQDSQVNPMQVVLGFAQAGVRKGVRVHQSIGMPTLIKKGSFIEKIIIPDGFVHAKAYILCSGVYTPFLLTPLGLKLDLRPRRGQLVATEAAPRIVNHILLCARYIAAKFHPELLADAEDEALRLGVGLALEQTASGTILIGSTREFAGYDTSTTAEGVGAILRHATRIFPVLDNLNAIRTFAGLRPYTPDGFPYLGLVPEMNNLYVAAGHEGDGIALAPITGKLMAQLITGGEIAVSLKEFAPDRFQSNNLA